MENSFRSLNEFLYPYALWFMILTGIAETHILIRVPGKIKRGIKIWSKPLPEGANEYLSGLVEDVIELSSKQLFLKVHSFIRFDNNEVIISYRKPNWNTSWPYIGYVDLAAPEPRLEYRAAFASHALILLLIFQIPWIPFFLFLAFMMVVNFRTETKAIDSFLYENMKLRDTRLRDSIL